jgi:hypothetical protein
MAKHSVEIIFSLETLIHHDLTIYISLLEAMSLPKTFLKMVFIPLNGKIFSSFYKVCSIYLFS